MADCGNSPSFAPKTKTAFGLSVLILSACPICTLSIPLGTVPKSSQEIISENIFAYVFKSISPRVVAS